MSLQKEVMEKMKEAMKSKDTTALEALRALKSAFNAELDGQAGIQELAGNATLLYYLSDEAKEGKNSFLEKMIRRQKQWTVLKQLNKEKVSVFIRNRICIRNKIAVMFR